MRVANVASYGTIDTLSRGGRRLDQQKRSNEAGALKSRGITARPIVLSQPRASSTLPGSDPLTRRRPRCVPQLRGRRMHRIA